MIATFVNFRFGDDFNEAKIREIADGARPKFQGMPGLRSKVFTAMSEAIRRRDEDDRRIPRRRCSDI